MTGNRVRHIRCTGTVLLSCLVLTGVTGQANENKSGVAPNVISLPSGPGSIEGLGEAFQPSLNSGTGSQSVNLQLPPGTAGHPPELTLVYEGGGGNGPLGMGWSVPLPSIQRRTETGIPHYVDGPDGIDNDSDDLIDEPDELDEFINESSEVLLPVLQEGQTNFFCEVEGSFIRYRRVADYWEGHLPNGTRLVFGQSASARVADPADPSRVFRWLLENEVDTHGNTIRYRYVTFPGDADQGQVYLRAVEYGPGAAPWGGRFHFAHFDYEDRVDWFEDCRSTFPVRTGKRLTEVVIGTQGVALPHHATGDYNEDGTGDALNRIYRLTYLAEAPVSLLHRVTLVGADGVSTLPPATYGYTLCSEPPTVSALGEYTLSENTPFDAFDLSTVDFSDLNGDGLPDLLKTSAFGGAHQAFINEGESSEAGQSVIAWRDGREIGREAGAGDPWALGLDQDEVLLSDVDGDGRSDLIQMSPFDTYYFRAIHVQGGVSRWGARQALSVTSVRPPSPFGSGGTVRTMDINFDKRMDIVQSVSVAGGSDYRLWLNLADDIYSNPTTVSPAKGYDFSDASVQLADINGDRLQDVARIRPSEILFTAHLGHGNFLPEESLTIPEWTLNAFEIGRASLRDVNGDGLDDLVVDRPEPQTIWIWPNRGNRTLGRRIIVTGLPASYSLSTAVRWVDLNGNGTTDLVFGDSTLGTSERVVAIDVGRLMGCVPRPYLLNHADNGIGGVTEITYQTSTAYLLADGTDSEGNYEYAWAHPLPFPVEVVSRIETSDSLGHTYVTELKYHDGYYDPTEKQFRGFARAEQIDVGDVTAPTLVTRSTFDVGADYRAMKGKLVALSVEQEDGSLFHEEITSWQVPPRTLYPSTTGRTVYYAFATNSLKRVVELGQGTERLLEQEFAYDNYGNQTLHADYGIVEPGERNVFDDERITVNEFAVNLTDWIIQAPSRTEIMDEHGAVISRTEYYYDDPTFSGDNLGVVSLGDLTLTRAWIDPAVPSAFVRASRTVFDAFGNATRILDPLSPGVPDPAVGHYREVVYDPEFSSYAEQEIIHVGGGADPLVVQVAYDQGFGIVVSSTNMNGHPSEVGYDTFARPVQMIRPGDTAAFPTTEYDYVLAVPHGTDGVVNYVESRSLDKTPGSVGAAKRDRYLITRSFVDGMGRTLMTKQEAGLDPVSGSPLVSVKDAVTFNARRDVHQLLNPYYVTESGFDFESIEAPGWTGRFHESGDLLTLDLDAAHRSTTLYDAQLRATKVINQDGSVAETMHEPLVTRGFDENDTDPSSPYFQTPMVLHHDGLGRMIRSDQLVRLNDDGTPSETLNTWSLLFGYDLNDQPIRVTDAQGNVRSKTFDGLKRMLTRHDPDQGLNSFVYDEASNLIETTDAKGQRVTLTYDGVNRRLTEDYHDEGLPFSFNRVYNPALPISASNRPDVQHIYDAPVPALDQGDGTTATASNTLGRIASVIDLSGEEHTSYDERGRVAYEVKRVPDFYGGQLVSYTTRQTYDSLNRVVDITYPDNDVVHYAYDERSLLGRIFGDHSGDILSSVVYTPADVLEQCLYGNGVKTTRTFDRRLRMDSLETRSPSDPGSPLIHYGYTFDKVSNIDAIDDLRPQVQATDVLHNTQVFQYDDLYRLTQYHLTDPGRGAVRGGLDYRYDRIGNMLFRSSPASGQQGHIDHDENGRTVVNVGAMDSGGLAGSSGRSGRNPGDAPGPGALTSTGDGRVLRYDDNGNVTSLDGMTNTWDFKDRLVMVEDEKMRAEYTYDYTDRRITKKVVRKGEPEGGSGTLTTIYVNKGFEVRENAQPTKFLFHGDTRVARITGTLSSVADRVQRFTVNEGWNLMAVAVEAADAAAQLGVDTDPAIEACYRWVPETKTYVAVEGGDPLPAGSVFWLRSSADQALEVSGSYVAPTHQDVQPDGDFVPGAGLEAYLFEEGVSTGTEAGSYDARGQRWVTRFPRSLIQSNSPPVLVPPGNAFFIRTTTATNLSLSDPVLPIRYYHQDHLGSSSVITGADGSLVEESVFYPFGQSRHRHQAASVKEDYLFTQKERDVETRLDYFGARYYAAPLGRWLSVDPSADSQPGLTPYHYVENKPVIQIDPDGKKYFTVSTERVGRGPMARAEIKMVSPDPKYLRAVEKHGYTKERQAGKIRNVTKAAAEATRILKNNGGFRFAQHDDDETMDGFQKTFGQSMRNEFESIADRPRYGRVERFVDNNPTAIALAASLADVNISGDSALDVAVDYVGEKAGKAAHREERRKARSQRDKGKSKARSGRSKARADTGTPTRAKPDSSSSEDDSI